VQHADIVIANVGDTNNYHRALKENIKTYVSFPK
jgi:hypothetical protein